MIIEEWKPIVIFGKTFNGYSVSNTGKVRSHFKPIRIVERESGKIKYTKNLYEIDTSYIKELKIYKNMRNGFLKECQVTLTIPKEFFLDIKNFSELEFRSNSVSDKYRVSSSVHKLVMEAFKSIYQFPPNRFSKEVWEQCPQEIKHFIKETIIINHIDHNPENNNLDNLEYVTPRENTIKAKIHYGGNSANKRKLKENENNTTN